MRKLALLSTAAALLAAPALAADRNVTAYDLGVAGGVQSQVVFEPASGYQSYQQHQASVVDTIASVPQLSTFNMLLAKTGLDNTLRKGTYTVFAPSDEAFSAVRIKTANRLNSPENIDLLRQTLAYHIVPGKPMNALALKGREISPNTLQGAGMDIDGEGRNILFGGGRVVQADLTAPNGVVHIIDKVMLLDR